jgi:hypothetical protein
LGLFAHFARQSHNSYADQEADKHRGVADVLADELNHRFALRSALQARLSTAAQQTNHHAHDAGR